MLTTPRDWLQSYRRALRRRLTPHKARLVSVGHSGKNAGKTAVFPNRQKAAHLPNFACKKPHEPFSSNPESLKKPKYKKFFDSAQCKAKTARY